ncbi:endonuclease III [Desulfovibrio sp. OttesenSCG-928-C06]|nr:endonuclease III [Desulfovibrio sp. OttesenSCG-928-C06]
MSKESLPPGGKYIKSPAVRKERGVLVLDVLQRIYPQLRPHLVSEDAWELLVATVLAAQCTDARVNTVTPELFRRLPDVHAFAQVSQEELEGLIRSTGFYHNKAKNLIAAAKRVVEVYGGKVPDRMEDLVTLGGVARKTANVVLWGSFGKNEGLAVDTHVARISVRLGLCPHGSPEFIEKELCAVLPRAEWGNYNHRMVSFGRDVCMARSPNCPDCPMLAFCPRLEPARVAKSRGK